MAKQLPLITGIILIIVSLWVFIFQTRDSKIALEQEHERVKVVHDKIKKILKDKKIDINLKQSGKDKIAPLMINQYLYFIRAVCFILFVGGIGLLINYWN